MILILPIGAPDPKALEAAVKGIRKTFSRRAVIGEEEPLPMFAWNPERDQFLSTAIINRILDEKGFDSYERVLAVMEGDAYAQGLNFVFGEAGTRAAVVSLARLKQGFYGLPEDQELFERRVATETVHELGHTYGLAHCEAPGCVMFFSNSIADTDRKSSGFCRKCFRRLQALGIVR